MLTCTQTRNFGPLAFTKFDLMGIRFEDLGGDGTGAGGTDDKGGEGKGGDGENKNEPDVTDAGKQAIDRMKKDRDSARAESKAFKALGLTPDEIAELVSKNKDGNEPDTAAIERKAKADADAAARERTDGKFRASAVREQAALLGFADPKDALGLLSASDLADVDVDDDGEVDGNAIKALLNDLAKNKPYLLTTKDKLPSAKDVGLGSQGSGAKPESQPGQDRMRNAYSANSGRTKR